VQRETQNRRDSLTAPLAACSFRRLPALIDVILTSEVHVHSPANLLSNLCPSLVRPAFSCCSRNKISFSNSAGSSGTLIPFSKSNEEMRRFSAYYVENLQYCWGAGAYLSCSSLP